MTRRKAERVVVAYTRVSSQAQQPDLENQIEVLEQFCAASGFEVDEWVREIGGGLNFTRRKFTQVIDRITKSLIGLQEVTFHRLSLLTRTG